MQKHAHPRSIYVHLVLTIKKEIIVLPAAQWVTSMGCVLPAFQLSPLSRLLSVKQKVPKIFRIKKKNQVCNKISSKLNECNIKNIWESSKHYQKAQTNKMNHKLYNL